MPTWVINSVKGLMTNVTVTPLLRDKTNIRIRVNRGVKQGCPLSPLLFILAYNPMIDQILKTPGAGAWAFADDAVLDHHDPKIIHQFTKIIDDFARISGFGVNRNKSTILHTMKPTSADKQIITQDWTDLKFTNKATYLGLLVGYDISNVDIFQVPLKRFKDKILKYSSALRHSSIQNRILIFNIYLLPIFSYLQRYYITPYKDIITKVNNIIRRNIIPFNGGAHKYIHLITPTNLFGPKTPLRDLWALGHAALTSQFDYTKLKITEKATVPTKEYINDNDPREWEGLLIEDHITCAALELVNDIIPKRNNKIDITPLDVSKYKYPKKQLNKICYRLALTEYHDDIREDLDRKLTIMKMDDPQYNSNPLTSSNPHDTDSTDTTHDNDQDRPIRAPSPTSDHSDNNTDQQTPGQNFMMHGKNILTTCLLYTSPSPRDS